MPLSYRRVEDMDPSMSFIKLMMIDAPDVLDAAIARLPSELTERFGGVTAFLRSPAVGAWQDPSGEVCRDDVYLYEVLADTLDRGWWRAYRARLVRQFSQDVILVRVTDTEVI